jgi:nondiscriminating glutamyl-tRNA synthetase
VAQETQVRVRMAPSPTGPIHVGNLHTALFNWLFARSQNGVFILRFEDTDQERSKPEWESVIYNEMRWLGLTWDEGPDIGGAYGPYRQMERLGIYDRYAKRLIESDHAYFCYCTPEELAAERAQAQEKGAGYTYSRRCLHLSATQRAALEREGRQPTIRFRVPDGSVVCFEDILRGQIQTPTDDMSDPIIVRSNGVPTYNFAVAVDDIEMRITHVIRGEGHISNTPQQILIYEALGAEPPVIAHVGHILGSDRTKLSKRHGDSFVGDYRDKGFLPEALLNFLVLMGWSPVDGNEEISRERMIAEFSLDRVTRAPSIFDLTKLEWLNGYYIRSMPIDELTQACVPFLQKAGYLSGPPEGIELERLEKVVALAQERIKVLSEIGAITDFFFCPPQYDPKAVKKALTAKAKRVLMTLEEKLSHTPWQPTDLEAAVRGVAEQLEVKARDAFQPLRIAITGRLVSPPLVESMEILGRQSCLERIRKAITLCGPHA